MFAQSTQSIYTYRGVGFMDKISDITEENEEKEQKIRKKIYIRTM